MWPNIRWIVAQYGFAANNTDFAVPENAQAKLQEMARELVGTTALAVIYVPLGTEDIYQPGPLRGRVVSAVRLLPIPPGGKMEDYSCPDWDENDANPDWDGTLRWPIGWPCQVVYAPLAAGPELRDHVEHLWPGSFQGYMARFQHGPFPLEQVTRDRLNHDFAEFQQLS
jgi:hypothetical protein